MTDAWVFQLPRLPGADERLRRQLAMLPELARELSSAVPELVYASTEPVAMGYRRIEGRPMAVGVNGIWPERLGRFLFDLHMVPPELVGMRSSTAAAVRERLRAEVASLRASVLSTLASDERARAERTIEAFLGDDDNFRFRALPRAR